VRWALAWPIAWFAYTLVHGAVGGWYPYPFVDVGVLGYAVVARNCAVVTVLLLGVAGAYLWGDHRLSMAPGPARAGAWVGAQVRADPGPPQS
jgi:hypothetical protein